MIRIIYPPKQKKSTLEKLNSPITAAIALAAFVWLAWYSYPRYDMHGNTRESVDKFYKENTDTKSDTLYDIYFGGINE